MIKIVTSGKKRLDEHPSWSLWPLNVMCLTDRQFSFSHILLSLPLIPTLSNSPDGKDSQRGILKLQDACGMYKFVTSFFFVLFFEKQTKKQKRN